MSANCIILIKTDIARIQALADYEDVDRYAVAEIVEMDVRHYFGECPFCAQVLIKFRDEPVLDLGELIITAADCNNLTQ